MKAAKTKTSPPMRRISDDGHCGLLNGAASRATQIAVEYGQLPVIAQD